MSVVRQPCRHRLFLGKALTTLTATAIICSTSIFAARSTAQTAGALPGIEIDAQANQGNTAELRVAPPEPWVKKLPLDLDAPRPAATDSGMYLRLNDQQVHLERHAHYSRYADEFVNIAGLHDQAEVVIEYDPAYETLTLHEVVLHRHGRTIDVLAAARSQKLLRLLTPEEEADDKILSGHHQLLLPIPDARVGDVVDYSYTLSGRLPHFENEFTDQVLLQRAEPVQQLRYRLLKSPTRELHWKGHLSDLQPKSGSVRSAMGSARKLHEYVWQQRDTQAVFKEPDTPGWHQPFAFIQLTSFATWNDVAVHGLKLYDFSSEALPTDLKKKISDLRLDHKTPEARALAAVRMVQDEIRYLAITDGAGAYCPDSPATTWQRRFGDCKSKTALLKRILSELDINSTPVFVDLDATPRGFDWLPTPSGLVFDHVILRIDYANGKTAWADGTASLERGPLPTTDPGDFFLGLPLAGDSTDLVKFPTEVIHETPPHRHVVESVQLGDIGQVSNLKVHTTYLGNVAGEQRHYFAVNHPDLVQRSHARPYHRNFPAMKFPEALPDVNDNETTGALSFTQHYQLGDLWQKDAADDGYHSVYLYFESIRNSLKVPLNLQRKMPFDLGPPRHFRHTSIVSLPADQEWAFEDENHFIEEAGVRFERSVRQDGHELKIELNLSNSDDHVLPEQVEAYAEAVGDMIDLCHYSIWRLSDPHSANKSSDKSPNPQDETAAADPEPPRAASFRYVIELTLLCVIAFLGARLFSRQK